MNAVTPRKGLRFEHSRQIDRHGNPEVCEVTAVRQGTVYYRNSTGFLTKTPVTSFSESVLAVLPGEA